MANREELHKTLEELIEFDVKAGIEFIKKYHPTIWQSVDHGDIGKILAIGHIIYKVRPELLEATNKGRLPFVQ